jgi:hypothetical protein
MTEGDASGSIPVVARCDDHDVIGLMEVFVVTAKITEEDWRVSAKVLADLADPEVMADAWRRCRWLKATRQTRWPSSTP